MGVINVNDMSHYVGTGEGTKFFKLENDKDVAVIRFMINTFEDLTPVVVHEIEINGKRRFVNCLRNYDESEENCPLCHAGNRQLVRLFIPVYNEDAKEVQFWQKGIKFGKQLESICRRYNPLVGTKIEVERNGKKGEQTTTYALYPQQSDNVSLKDLPEIPKIVGAFVLDKNYEELSKFIEKGFFEGDVLASKRENTEINRSNSVVPRRGPAF